ncbi:MAG: hypothetical protein ACFB14_17840 [Leptolyngbyaceae cyanobacterium]
MTKPSQLLTPAIARQPKEIAAEHRQSANVRNGIYLYSILIQVQTQIASQSNPVNLSVNELVLQDAHRISALDQVSQNVLNECLIELNV